MTGPPPPVGVGFGTVVPPQSQSLESLMLSPSVSAPGVPVLQLLPEPLGLLLSSSLELSLLPSPLLSLPLLLVSALESPVVVPVVGSMVPLLSLFRHAAVPTGTWETGTHFLPWPVS